MKSAAPISVRRTTVKVVVMNINVSGVVIAIMKMVKLAAVNVWPVKAVRAKLDSTVSAAAIV